MSASRTLLLARSLKKEDDDADYDSEEERYQRNQDRLLRKVEESAAAIRKLNEITRPFVTGSLRLEREEKRNEELMKTMVKSSLTPFKENKPCSSISRSSTSKKGDDPRTTSTSGGDILTPLKKSVRSPVKYVKSKPANSVLEIEKALSWKPLRRSKVRLSQIFDAENTHKSHSVSQEAASIVHNPVTECISSKPACKPSEELRTPLKTVASANQSQLRRDSVSQPDSHDTTSLTIHSSELQASHEISAATYDNEDVIPEVENIIHCKNEVEETMQLVNVPSADQDEVQQQTPIRRTSRVLKSFKSPIRCSPILLQAYGKEHALVRGSIGSPEKVVNLDDCHSPKDPSKVLKGVVAYAEVRRGEDDRTGGFRWKLKQLGATVSDTLNKKVTHVVFQEGLLSTFRKAKQIGAHIVSTHWVMACDESFTKVSEARYPIEKLSNYELADPHIKTLKRPKIMSPDLGDDKKLTRRFKAIERRSMRVESPLARTSHSVASSIEEPETLIATKDSLRLSPKTMPKVELELDDDWDGFLAMVEAQVREKAQSRMDHGDDSEMDFETKLQLLLGRKKAEEKSVETSPPLASIFQNRKASNTVHIKTSPKKVKRTKQAAQSTASSSVMMNWLQRCSPESRDLSSQAASAAADEIIESMFKCFKTEQSVKTESPTQTVTSKNTFSPNKANQCVQTVREAKSKKWTSSKNCSQDLFVFTAKQGNSKPVDNTKRQVKKNKLDFKGSAASSGMMLNWLSSSKSPPPSHKSPVKSNKLQSGALPNEIPGKRKASFNDSETIFLKSDCENLASFNTPKKLCRDTGLKKGVKAWKEDCSPSNNSGRISSSTLNIEAHQMESTPRKTDSNITLKSSCSAKKGAKDHSATPRRRSQRLTPMKTSALPSNSSHLGTVEEGKVCLFEEEKTVSPGSPSATCDQDNLSGDVTPNCSKEKAGRVKKLTPSKKTAKSGFDVDNYVTKRQTPVVSSGRKNSSRKSTPVACALTGTACATPQTDRSSKHTKKSVKSISSLNTVMSIKIKGTS